MKKEDLIRKLTSRKFAAALIGFVTAILVAFNVSENDIAQVAAIIGSFLTLIAYIIAEGQTDVASLNASTTYTTINKSETKSTSTAMSKDLNQADKKEGQS